MARLVLATAGAAVGSFFGPWGTRIGWTVGSILGGALSSEKTKTEGPRMADLKVMSADEGADIPRVYGSMRVAGTVIWADDITEEAVTTSEGGKGGPKVESTTYRYYGSMLVALHDGEITGVRKVWADSKLIYSAADDITPAEAWRTGPETLWGIRVYKGTETQTADPMYQAAVGAANAPAFRGTAYLAFEDFDLTEYGNRIPNITAEVVTGTSDPPPNRLNSFVGTDAEDKEWANASCKDGVLYTQSWDAVSANTIRWTQTMYDLNGNKIGERRRSFDNPFNSTSVYFVGCKGSMNYGYGRKSGAGTGYGTSRFMWKGIDAGQPIPGGGSTNYESIVSGSLAYGAMLFHNGYLYTLSYGLEFNGVVRYPFWNNQAPAMLPNLFIDLEPYYDGAGGDLGQLNAGDDGNIYVAVSDNIDDEVHDIIILDADLNYIDYINLSTLGIEPSRHSIWVNQDGTRMGMVYGTSPSGVRYIDISDRQNPVLLGSSTTSDLYDTAYMESPLAIGNGLYVTRAGIYNFNELLANTGVTLQSIVEDICDEAGIESANLDASALSSTTVHGYVRSRVMSARAALEPLRQAYFFDLIASDDKLIAVMRGGASVLTLTADDMVTGSANDAYPVDCSIADELSLPAVVSIGFIGSANDYQPGARRSRRYVGTTTNADGTLDISLPIAMSSGGGAQIADLVLRTVWAESESYQFRLPPKYAYLEPGDVVSLALPNGTIKARIVRFDLGVDYTIDVEAVREFGDYTSAAPDITSYIPATINLVGPTLYEMIDVACLRDSDDAPGYYVAMCGVYSGWPGAILFTSPDGSTYGQTGAVTMSASIGVCTTAPNNSVTSLGYDVISSVIVDLFNDTLSLTSVSETDFLNGANVALMGNEVIAFKDVTDNGNGTYTLKTLMRGLCGTHNRMDQHEDYERFVLLTGNGMHAINGAIGDSGVDKYLRFVTINTALENADTEVYTLTNARIKPAPPSQAVAVKTQTSGDVFDWVITWNRSARIAYEWVDLIDTPLDETAESYEVDILNSAGTVVRTIASSTGAITYTSAQQYTDFGYSPATLLAEVYQISDRVNRGFASSITSDPPSWHNEIIDMYRLYGIRLGWHFTTSGTSTDMGTEGATLTWSGSPSSSTDLPYVYSVPSGMRSKSLTTSSHYASASNDTDWVWTTELSVGAWFKSSMTPGTTYVVPFISKWSTTVNADKGWRIGFDNDTAGYIRFAWRTSTGLDITIVTSTSGWNDGLWHFAVGVHTAGDTKIYIDGVSQGLTGSYQGSTDEIQSTTTTVELGRHANVLAGDNFVGNLAFAGAWNQALTENQVKRLYNRGVSGGVLL